MRVKLFKCVFLLTDALFGEEGIMLYIDMKHNNESQQYIKQNHLNPFSIGRSKIAEKWGNSKHFSSMIRNKNDS